MAAVSKKARLFEYLFVCSQEPVSSLLTLGWQLPLGAVWEGGETGPGSLSTRIR
jgi:hypothetical protein